MSVIVIFSVDFSRQLRHRGNSFTLYHVKKVLSVANGTDKLKNRICKIERKDYPYSILKSQSIALIKARWNQLSKGFLGNMHEVQ